MNTPGMACSLTDTASRSFLEEILVRLQENSADIGLSRLCRHS